MPKKVQKKRELEVLLNRIQANIDIKFWVLFYHNRKTMIQHDLNFKKYSEICIPVHLSISNLLIVEEGTDLKQKDVSWKIRVVGKT